MEFFLCKVGIFLKCSKIFRASVVFIELDAFESFGFSEGFGTQKTGRWLSQCLLYVKMGVSPQKSFVIAFPKNF